MYRVLALVLACTNFCVSVEYSREKAGYARGLLANCPGSNKPREIPKKLLNQLYFVVPGSSSTLPRKKYTYFSAVNGISKDPRIDFRRKTLVFIIGYTDSANFPITRVVSAAYSEMGYNVIVPDYNRFTTFFYPYAVRLMRTTGKYVAEVLANLTHYGLEPSRTELLGLSLGGQTVSFIAKNYRQFTGRNLSRVTSLDPAGPCFRELPPSERLDASDADFVDVINTNIDGLGMATPVGHVNFYVNGGEYQPFDLVWLPCGHGCSHIKAFVIWMLSLYNPEGFVAIKCDSVQQARDNLCYDRSPVDTNVLGPNTNRSVEGVFYLATAYTPPYFLGQNGINREYEVWKTLARRFNIDFFV